METLIRESVKAAPVKTEGNRWRVIVAKPGQGSSGKYSAEVLKRDAQKMLPAGAQAFINHDDKRDPRDMLGVYEDGGVWSDEDQAVVSELAVFEHWKSFVETLAPHAGISLYALGDKDTDDNVTAFFEDDYNGADLVSRPGLKGSGFDQKLYEAARSASASEGIVPDERKEQTTMEIKELADKVEALTTSVEALVSAQKAKVDEAAQIEADDAAVEARVAAVTASLDAVEAAREELLPSQVESLRAEAKAGKDVAPLIESAKAVKTELEKDVETRLGETYTPGGRIKGSDSGEFKIGAWSE